MATLTPVEVSKLKATLLTSGIQIQNNALYQVVNQLINGLAATADNVAIINDSTSTTSTDGKDGATLGLMFEDGLEGERGFPGTKGDTGNTGNPGNPGSDGYDADEPLIIPGPRGDIGLTGNIGIPGYDGDIGEDSFIPGPQGLVGNTGPQGRPGLDGEDRIEEFIQISLPDILPVRNGGTGNNSFTLGSIIFSDGSKLTQDNANLFWDDTNNYLGIGTSSPARDIDLVKSVAGNDLTFRIKNTDNMSSLSNAVQAMSNGGSAGGNVYNLYTITGVRSWSFGIDNADSQKFKISLSGNLGTNDRFVIDTSADGHIGIGGSTNPNNALSIGGGATRSTTQPAKGIDIFNGTAPAGTLANGATVYVQSGELYVMDSAGNATLLS